MVQKHPDLGGGGEGKWFRNISIEGKSWKVGKETSQFRENLVLIGNILIREI